MPDPLMRPLCLGVENLTAFRGAQPVLELRNYDLFAIAGPTGSGKTSLLDAILIALYGEVPRTGNSLKELISQGRDRMCVRLDFGVTGAAYRVTRVVYANTRPSEAILERLVDGAEPIGVADRVTAVEAEIQRLIGLNYDAFTQAVILPQGKFDLFLRSKPRERNDILKELLRLQVYERMRERAESEAKASDAEVKMLAQMLEQTYAGVTPDAFVDISRNLDHTRKANATLVKKIARATTDTDALRGRVTLLRDLVDARKTLHDLDLRKKSVAQDEACLSLARQADVVVPQLDSANRARAELDRAQVAANSAKQKDRLATEAHERTSVQLRAASKAAARIPDLEGRIEGLGRAVSLAERIADAQTRLAQAKQGQRKRQADSKEVAAEAVAAKENVERAHRAADARRAEEKVSREKVKVAERTLQQAENEREAGARANFVAHLRHGLRRGDPCPICERPLQEAPPRTPGSKEEALVATVNRARNELSRAQDAYEGSRSRVEGARQAHESAQADARAAEKGVLAAADALAEASRAFEATTKEVDSLLDRLHKLTKESDPATAQDTLRSEKNNLQQDLVEAQRANVRTGRAAASASAAVEATTARLSEATTGASTEARRAAKALTQAGFTTEKAARAAQLTASEQRTLAKSIDDWRRRQHAAAARVAALEAAADKDTKDAALGTLAKQLEACERELREFQAERDQGLKEESRLDQQRRDLERRLAEAEQRRKALEAARVRVGPLRQLALDLRSNQFQAYLLEETFRELVAGASERLLRLSGRYGFGYEKEAFFVIDHDNASQPRRAETLSGGETFLASLALALELSQQVQRAAGAVDIESLFIDEGFGALDAEALDLVADAIESLPTAGRMVGIITHLPELTARLPVCLDVEKGAEGSRVRVRSA